MEVNRAKNFDCLKCFCRLECPREETISSQRPLSVMLAKERLKIASFSSETCTFCTCKGV